MLWKSQFGLTACFCKTSEIEIIGCSFGINICHARIIMQFFASLMQFWCVWNRFLTCCRHICNGLQVCFRPVADIFPTGCQYNSALFGVFLSFYRGQKRLDFRWLNCKYLDISFLYRQIAFFDFGICDCRAVSLETNDSGALGYAKWQSVLMCVTGGEK